MANDGQAYWSPGTTITVLAGGAITGKRFVKISATPAGTSLSPTVVQTSMAAIKGLGVAIADAASGAKFTIYNAPGQIIPVSGGASITAGAELELDSAGRVVTYSAGIKVGQALSDGVLDGDVMVKLY